MIDEIKSAAGRVSEDYILHKKDMTDAILDIAKKSKYNDEIIKRICEFANQNTYLSLFHADKEKRGNISFDLADSKKIIDKIKELNMSERDYMAEPEDFRVSDEYGQEEERSEHEEHFDDKLRKHLDELKADIRLNDRLSKLLNAIKTMTSDEEAKAEDNVMKVSSYCKGLTFNGESFMDMVKLAMRYTKERGYDIEKTARLYSMIGDYLNDKGFKVNTEITKISSLKINQKSSIYEPLENYHMSLIKLSGLREMKENLEKVCECMSKKVAKVDTKRPAPKSA